MIPIRGFCKTRRKRPSHRVPGEGNGKQVAQITKKSNKVEMALAPSYTQEVYTIAA